MHSAPTQACIHTVKFSEKERFHYSNFKNPDSRGKFLSYFSVAITERLGIFETNRNLTMLNSPSCSKVVSPWDQNKHVNTQHKFKHKSAFLSVTSQLDPHLK